MTDPARGGVRRSVSASRGPLGPVSVNRSRTEMAWSGIQAFLKLPVCLTPEDLRAGGVDVAIEGAFWDGTSTGLTGTHFGPSAIRQGGYITDARRLSHLDVQVVRWNTS